METILKYPRTPHLEGSCLQVAEKDKLRVPYSELAGKFIVVERKMDGANSAVSISDSGDLLLQSRGHYLVGGARERHFNLFKTWAAAHADMFFDLLSGRYVMYGEFMRTKHSIFYDRLPHYFLEFDIFDKFENCFLSTGARRGIIGNAPILPVPVIYTGVAPTRLEDLVSLIGPSISKTSLWKETLRELALRGGLDPNKVLEKETDLSDLDEGLYIKVEQGDRTIGRCKWVRGGFVQTILGKDEDENPTHWMDRPFINNQLADGADIFSPDLKVSWEDILASSELIKRPTLLSREQFRKKVFERDKGRCVFCREAAADAHHILDRKLFKDGGYYLNNGAAVCSKHHLDCEEGRISVEDIRYACRIVNMVLPPGLDPGLRYDKWGKNCTGGFKVEGRFLKKQNNKDFYKEA